MSDSTMIKAHSQVATYKKKTGIRPCVGGLTGKIPMLCDALGNSVKFFIPTGQVHDMTQANRLLEGETADSVIADKGTIQPEFFERIQQMGSRIVIPNRSSQKRKRGYDKVIYKDRNLIERHS